MEENGWVPQLNAADSALTFAQHFYMDSGGKLDNYAIRALVPASACSCA